MMSDTRSVETSAADIEAAIELGLKELGVSRESVIVEILEEPSRGLLGLGARHARVRLTTAAPPRPAPDALPPATAEPVAPVAQEEPAAPVAELAPADHFDDTDVAPLPASADELDEDAQVGMATLRELLSKMHIEAGVTAYRATAEDNETAPWVLQIQGNDLGMLIGRRGETLSALQYITRLIVSRELQRRANIVLDVEGYKSRREKQLRQLAQRMADQALQMRRIVTLEPMSPYERRIVHLELRSNPEVETESVGEGDHRKVTIIPLNR